MMQYAWLLLCIATWSVSGSPPVPSKPYRKDVNVSYHNLLAEEKTTLLYPLELESSGSGENSFCSCACNEELCSGGCLQHVIDTLQQISSNCVDRVAFQNCCEPKYLGHNWLKSTIYPIQINSPSKQLSRFNFAYCDQETDGGGWMVILRRGYKQKFRSSFYDKSYRKFEVGFGKVDRDFWMGLKAVQYFTDQEGGVELQVELKRGNQLYSANYNNFSLGDRSTGYAIEVGGYWENSTLPDSLSYSNGHPFQIGHINVQCFEALSGPWWYREVPQPLQYNHKLPTDICSRVNLFRTKFESIGIIQESGPMWEIEGETVTFDYVEMKIRPKTWECGEKLYSEYELKKAYLYPQYP